jgi:hypothetical protein
MDAQLKYRLDSAYNNIQRNRIVGNKTSLSQLYATLGCVFQVQAVPTPFNIISSRLGEDLMNMTMASIQAHYQLARQGKIMDSLVKLSVEDLDKIDPSLRKDNYLRNRIFSLEYELDMLRSQDDYTSRKRVRDNVSTMSLQDRIDRAAPLLHRSDDYYDSSRVLADLRISPLFTTGSSSGSLQDAEPLVWSKPQHDIMDVKQSHIGVGFSTFIGNGHLLEQEPRSIGQPSELPDHNGEKEFDEIMATLDSLVDMPSGETPPDGHAHSNMHIPVRRCLAVAIEQEAVQPKGLVDDSRARQNLSIRQPLATISSNLSDQPTQQYPSLKMTRPLQRISIDVFAPTHPETIPGPQLDKADTHQPKYVSPKPRMRISFKVSSRRVIPKYNPPWMAAVEIRRRTASSTAGQSPRESRH